MPTFDEFTIEDFLASAGVQCRVSRDLGFTAELGEAMGREVDLNGKSGNGDWELDVDSEMFARVGLQGPF